MTRGRRLAAQLVLLVVLFVLEAIDDNLLYGVVGAALIVIWPFSLVVAGLLVWTSRQAPEIESLRERADDAVTLALLVSAAAIAGGVAIGKLYGVQFFGKPALVLLAYALLLGSVPAIGWLSTWRTVWLPMLKLRRPDLTRGERQRRKEGGPPATDL